MIIQVLHCPYCQGTDIVRHGNHQKANNATAAASVARDVDARFCSTNTYVGQSPEVKEPIVDMAMNASGIRDTARVYT